MRKLFEYTLASIDGVFEGRQMVGFAEYRDEAYARDRLEQAMAREAILMGRATYEEFSQLWPKRSDPWANRINTMKKYVFSSKLERAHWSNCTLIRGDALAEIKKLKQENGGDLVVYGHGLLAQTLFKNGLIDVLDVVVHPLFVGTGKQLFQDGLAAKLRFGAARCYSKGIVGVTYEQRV